MFVRTAEQAMLRWKNTQLRNPLLVDGARQVGKSFLIEKVFAPKHFKHVLKLDFMAEPELKRIFEQGLKPEVIIRNAQLATGQRFNADTDLLFFEEVGMCRAALESLKYFSQDAPELHLIATGSNIGLFGKFPVGKTHRITVYPMSFEEFLLATEQELLADCLHGEPSSISEFVHDKLMMALQDYYFTGGMPDVIKAWCQNDQSIINTLNQVRETQNQLIADYINDFAKFSEGEKMSPLLVASVYKNIPTQLAQTLEEKPIPRFQFSRLNSGRNISYADISSPIAFLEQLNLIRRINLIDSADPRFPLLSQRKESQFKLALTDIGLLNAMLDIQYQQVLNKDFAFKGFIAEVFVLNEMLSANLRPHQQAFYSYKRREAEVEFVLQGRHGYPVPVEVKSGTNTKAKSLNALVRRHDLPKAYKLTGNLVEVNKERQIEQWPIYLARHLYESEILGVRQ